MPLSFLWTVESGLQVPPVSTIALLMNTSAILAFFPPLVFASIGVDFVGELYQDLASCMSLALVFQIIVLKQDDVLELYGLVVGWCVTISYYNESTLCVQCAHMVHNLVERVFFKIFALQVPACLLDYCIVLDFACLSKRT